MLHDTTYKWDTAASTCRQPDAIVDNLLCSSTKLKLAGDANPSATTDVLYNNEGYPLITTQRDPNNSSSTFTTTDGYHVQYIDAAGAVHHYDDTPTGNSAVTSTSTSGKRTDPTGQPPTAFAIVDHTAHVTAIGNAASPPGGFQAYETTWRVDAPTSGDGGATAFHSGNLCSGTTYNTGVICEQHVPASDASPTSCTEASGTRGCDLTRYTYDQYGARLTMATPKAIADGSSDVYQYGYAGDSTKDLSGHTSAGGWLTTVTDPTGHFVAYGYDAAGNRVRVWDRGATDRAGQPTSAYPGSLGSAPSQEYTQTLYATGSDSAAVTNPWRYVRASRDALGTSQLTVDADGNTRPSPHRGGPLLETELRLDRRVRQRRLAP